MMRGYDPALVDDFLDMVADRMEQLVRQNLSLNERLSVLEAQVADFKERERALTEALVTAQEMRAEIREQVQKEANIARREAESQAETIRVSALTARQKEEEAIRRLRARQMQLLGSYRSFLERELAELTVMAETLEVQRSRPVFMDEPLPGDEDLEASLDAPAPALARPAAPPPAARATAPAARTSGPASKAGASAKTPSPAPSAPQPAPAAPAPAAAVRQRRRACSRRKRRPLVSRRCRRGQHRRTAKVILLRAKPPGSRRLSNASYERRANASGAPRISRGDPQAFGAAPRNCAHPGNRAGRAR
jgi:hypothetical protein